MSNNQNNENMEIGMPISYDHEEFKQIIEIAASFTNKGQHDNPPQFAIITGGVGSGKTTVRKDKYGSGYVNLDFVDVLKAVKMAIGTDNQRLMDTAAITFRIIMNDSFAEKKNVVIEIIGDNYELIEKLLDAVKKLEYDIHIDFVDCEPIEAYKRHVKAVMEDPDYVSAFYAQDVTLSYLFQCLELGEYPVRAEEEARTSDVNG